MKIAAIADRRLRSFRLPILPALGLLIALSMTGCWIPASSGVPETPVSLNLPTQTPIPTETFTPEPSATDTPTEALDALAADTEEVVLTDEVGGTEVAQLDVTDEVPFVDDFNAGQLPTSADPLVQLATDLVATVTQESIDATATQESLFLVTPATNTPESIIPTLTPTTQFLASTPPPVVGGGGSCTRIVQAGDNLFRISLQYGVPIRDIAAANGIANPDLIIVGQTLNIPNCSGGGSTGGNTGGGSAGGISHVVEQGETLYQISVRYNVPIRSIAAANGIQNVNLIYFNQRLTIP